ncbi:hypothetical protein BRARA_C04192 [Brassica rapa]|uniref:Uncharacterized protein n=1 Tax=Brassica campestris TaxID=3711 RepID=A0A398A399_BRACM|nr:hypothetical protein BRARA_C04192 [Brassica rapa]
MFFYITWAISVEIRRLRRDPPSLSHTTGDENGLQRIAIQSLQMLIPVQDSQLLDSNESCTSS